MCASLKAYCKSYDFPNFKTALSPLCSLRPHPAQEENCYPRNSQGLQQEVQLCSLQEYAKWKRHEHV